MDGRNSSLSRSARADSGELVGVVERIIFFNEENHYCIAELKADTERDAVTIVGALPNVQCGETLKLSGEWTRHPQHGRQFKVAAFSSQLPATVYGIRKYLGSGLVPGIGKIYANKIVDHFGLDTFRIISEESALLRQVPGIGKGRARAIKEAWEEQRAVREIMMFLQTYGVGAAQCKRIVDRYGDAAREKLQTDPYSLARDFSGIGFKTADRIAINLGYANDSASRLDAGLLHLFDELEGEGHTCAPLDDTLERAAELLEAPPEKIAARISALVAAKSLIEHDSGNQNPILQPPALDRAERKIADSIHRILRGKSSLPPIKIEKAIEWAQERAGFAFAPEQARAVHQALASRLSIITGGPGTGKTSILQALVSILTAKKARVVLAAPTGRAAQRMAATTGGYAQTIHRLLRFDPAAGGFTVNADKPLKCDFLVVDEASMLDTRLAASLFQAIAPGTHLLLVGDVDQLPSVGPGDVLKTLIQSKIPAVTRLETIFRQAAESGIVLMAHEINRGNPGGLAAVRHFDEIRPPADFFFIETSSPEECLDQVVALCSRILPERFNLDPLADIQVLAPMHKGIAGVGNINAELQKTFQHHSGPAVAGIRAGDKVIQLRNNYDKGVFNGDLGAVIAVDPESGEATIEFDGERHLYERGALTDISLAYAISIHKSQGSEYHAVVVPLLKQHYVMLQRNLLYTAVTRGKRLVIVVGNQTAYAMAVKNFVTRERRTHLKYKLERSGTEGRR